ncbi:MAG: TadE family protein [Elusimicrobiota bacterium]
MRRCKCRKGQVLIEVMLMLPIFMLLVFTIMEIGHLAFRTILLHHAAYEVARIGSLTAVGPVASKSCLTPNLDSDAMDEVRQKILPASSGQYSPVPGMRDPQDCCMNFDLVVVLTDNVPMIFPMTGMVLGNANGKSARALRASVRMPIERPLFGGTSC